MHRKYFMILFLLLALAACSTMVAKGRMQKFGRTSEAFEFSLRDSDYRTANKFIHPSVQRPPMDEKHYGNIKIVEYKITHMDVSSDQLKIEQDIELQYFLLNSNRLHTAQHHQVWRFDESERQWQLYTALPTFGRQSR